MFPIFVPNTRGLEDVSELIMTDDSLFFEFLKLLRISSTLNSLNHVHVGNGQLK